MRFAIWVQGCAKRCPNCINPEGQNLHGGYDLDIGELAEKIQSTKNLTGITISGGEPFLQYEELKKLVIKIRKNSMLDVMLYSGYQYSELIKKYPNAQSELFPLVDIFIDGEYKDELNNDSMYRGSDNQKIYFFTKKYKQFEDRILSSKQRDFSFEINSQGEVIFIGVPPKGFYQKFLDQLEKESDLLTKDF